jgi:apolipoprotein N-acyltransferase
VSKRRHALNPAKLKADIAALDERPGPRAFRPRLDVRRRWVVAALCLLSCPLRLATFAPLDHWYLAYVALVPLGLAVVGGERRRWALLWAYLAGVIFWAVGLYWLTWITLVGYVVLIFYLGAYWLAAAAALRAAFQRRWPMWLTLPVVWVALEYARAYALWPVLDSELAGFPWFCLAHSQHTCTRLIQIADVTGQYGVSFFVAMVNGAVLDVLAWALLGRGVGRRAWRIVVPLAAAAVAAAALLGYGTFRLGQQTTRPGPKLGVVQLAFPISLAGRSASPQEIFSQHLHMSEQFKRAGLDLVVWPESMLGFQWMRPSYWFQFDPDAVGAAGPLYTPAEQERIRVYQQSLRRLQALLGELDCPLLAGGSMPSAGRARAEGLNTNSALLFRLDEGGRVALRGRYDKMHLVPFSEYVPFKESWTGLHKLLRRFVPEVMPQLDPGTNRVRLEIPCKTAGESVRFAVPICYEGVFARVCRRLATQDGQKRVDMLVNLSNDGWFIYEGRKYLFAGPPIRHASAELDQHLAQYVFRAVENRVPVIRAVNTGISAHVDSNGRVLSVVEHEGRRKMIGGKLVAQTLVDRRASLYSRFGDVFARVICCVAAAGLAVLLLRRRTAKH